MKYNHYYEDIIRKRESCRSFKDKAVEQEKIDALKNYYNEEDRLLPQIATELVFETPAAVARMGASIGYNGFVIKAPQYLLLFSDKADHYLANSGFIAEGLSLKMTEMGLASCWQTINYPDIAVTLLGRETDKALAVVIAFGYRQGRPEEDVRIDIKSPSNVKVTRSGSKAAPKIDLSELLYYKEYGREFPVDRLYDPLEDGLLAISRSQSFYNRQPYRVIVDDDIVSLIGIPDELTREGDRRLNYGIAMFNFFAVMKAFRSDAPLWSFDDPGRNLKLPKECTYVAKCGI